MYFVITWQLSIQENHYKDEQFKLVDMSFLCFRQNAGAGMEELKVEGGPKSMIVDVFIHCKYQRDI